VTHSCRGAVMDRRFTFASKTVKSSQEGLARRRKGGRGGQVPDRETLLSGNRDLMTVRHLRPEKKRVRSLEQRREGAGTNT